ETGRDIQRSHWVERIETALDGHRRVAIHFAVDVDRGRFRLAIVQRADLAIELLDGGGKVGGQAEVGKVGRTVIDVDFADTNAQWFFFARTRTGLGCWGFVRWLLDQQIIDVGGPVIVDHEPRI